MNRTSKALARIGIGAVFTAAALAAPLAIGTASAAVGVFSTGTTTDGSVTDVTTPPANYANEGQQTINFAGGTASITDTVDISLAGNAGAYFPTTQPVGITRNSSTDVTCAMATSGTGTGSCQVNVGDTVSELAHLNVQVTAGADTGTANFQSSLPFNALYFPGCASATAPPPAGIDTTANCVTQASVNTVTPELIKYVESGNGVAGKNLNAIISGTTGNPQFSASATSTITSPTNTTATCTTAADGTCTFNIVDATAGDNITLSVTSSNATPFPNVNAQQRINVQAASVAPAELDLESSKVIAPSTQVTAAGQTFAEPGDVIQNLYILRGSPQPLGPGCTTPNAPNTTTCPGVPLANTTLTLKVSDGFFTPNCGFPQTSFASTVVGSSAAPTNNNYGNCSFATAPAAGGVTGNLTNSTQSVTVKTDANGEVIVSLGIGKDAGFDDDGLVVASVTDGSIVPQVPGDNNSPTSSTCGAFSGVIDPTVASTTAESPNPTTGGCNVDVEWTTDEAPLNGGTAKDVVIPQIKNPNDTFIGSENNYDATDTGTINVPDVDRVVWSVHLTDQFGNLTSNRGAASGNRATITKTGPGNIVRCTGFNNTDACASADSGTIAELTQPDGTVTQVASPVLGSFTNNTANPNGQERYEANADEPGASDPVNNCEDPSSSADCGDSGVPGVNDGTQTDVTSWHPETSTFSVYTAGTSTTAAFAQFAAGTAATASTDTLTFNFYNQLAQPVITFSVKPGHKVPTGTGVTAAAKVLDQFQNPITDQLVQFVRTGSNEASCVPIQNGGGATTTPVHTNAAGVAGYTFSCNAAGTSTVSIVVTGPGETQLAQGKEAVKFTGQSLHLTKEKPTLKAHAKGHKVTLKVKTHPAVHGKTVNFYKINKHGLAKLFGQAKTGKSGIAKLHVHLKSGKYHFEAKVSGLKATKFNSKFSKTKKLVV